TASQACAARHRARKRSCAGRAEFHPRPSWKSGRCFRLLAAMVRVLVPRGVDRLYLLACNGDRADAAAATLLATLARRRRAAARGRSAGDLGVPAVVLRGSADRSPGNAVSKPGVGGGSHQAAATA